jgi:hypothetical protein
MRQAERNRKTADHQCPAPGQNQGDANAGILAGGMVISSSCPGSVPGRAGCQQRPAALDRASHVPLSDFALPPEQIASEMLLAPKSWAASR